MSNSSAKSRNWRKPPNIKLDPVGDTFWVVMAVDDRNPQPRHFSPCAKHPNLEAAEAEAKRLAAKKPGRRYAVLKVVDWHEVAQE